MLKKEQMDTQTSTKPISSIQVFPLIVLISGLLLILYAAYANSNDIWNWSTVQLLCIIGGAIAFVGLLLLFYVSVKKSTNNKSSSSYIENVSSNSSADELKKYKDLLDNGVITQEEFEAKKKQLLGL